MATEILAVDEFVDGEFMNEEKPFRANPHGLPEMYEESLSQILAARNGLSRRRERGIRRF